MADYPSMPLMTDAYLGDTRHLSLEQHGAYFLLLMIAWRSPDCALPDDDKKLARMVGVTAKKWVGLKIEVMVFWKLSEGKWRQKKLSKLRRGVAKKSDSNRKAAEARWNAKPLKTHNQRDANAYADVGAESDANAILTKTKEERKKEKDTSYPKRKPSNRGCRLPENWMPTEAHMAFAVKAIGGPAAQRELDKFKDWWPAQAGAKGVKLDWDRTWKNWIREAEDGRKYANRKNRGSAGSSFIHAAGRIADSEDDHGGDGLFKLPSGAGGDGGNA